MQNNFLEFSIRQNIKHAPSVLHGLENVQVNKLIETNQPDTVDTIGGIFRDGVFGWIVSGAHIEIVSLKNGNRIADYTFGDKRYSNTFIAFVTEVNIDQINTNLLAIGVHSSPTTSCIYLFAPNGSRIIHAIEIEEKLTSCSFIESQICADSALNLFDGCVIVGTETGKIIIIDLFAESCVRVFNGSEFFNNEPKLCKIISSRAFRSIETIDSDDFCFGVHLEDVTESGSALSILCLQPLLIVAVGFEDGKMLLYDLCTLNAFHIAHPPENDSPLERLTFIEPADDPRACVYLWSFHSNNRNAIAVLHSLTYEMKIGKPNGNGFVYKNFERCTPRLTMPMFEKYSKPISCQSITKFIAAEENFLTLCLLSWTSVSGAFVCVFDLNQWYKQQLPDTCDWRSSPTFLAIFPLGKQPVLDVWMNGVTVTPFSSLNRPEEHFYPSSLSFDCTLLTTNGSAKLHWLGLQNEALEHLNQNGPFAILEPNRCFAEMVRASLIPQFTDYSYDMNQSLKSKREFLLSIALEYNCINLLKRCANAWADGSHLSKNPTDGMSLSTLTDWIWNRATSIKECCNEMCVPLFDHSGHSIEPRSQKVLLNFSRQLKRLYHLMDMIVTTHQKYIPSQVLDTLKSQRDSICMANEYQDVLQWLLNVGLLPELNPNQSHKSYSQYRDSSFDDFPAVPYPYETIKNFYTSQRRKFCEINPNFIVPATKSCRILYIDSFIETECNSAVLRSEWRKGFGDGLYPPVSLQAMLRTLLVPGVSLSRKHMLFVYLFMDLSTVLSDERYAGVMKNLIKFPAVFKMEPGLIKTTQAFWNLDHGEYELAVDEIISPLAQDQNISTWQRELLIGALILHDVPHLALRVLHAPGSPISPSLEIRTLLANDLVADAFQVQRMKRNRDLLFEFFHGCHEQRKWHYLLNLSLNVNEEECLGEFLRSIQSSLGENINFIYLLRRSKYLEAVTFIAELHHKKQRSSHLDLNTPNTILSTYRLTMAPPIRKFSDLYYSSRDDINVKLNHKAKCPKPLSMHLSQDQFDVNGGVYKQSLIDTEQTSPTYWDNQEKQMCGLPPSNVPFLYGLSVASSPNNSFVDQMCYAEPLVANHKRRLNDSFETGDQGPPMAKRQRLDCSNVNTTLLTSFRGSSQQFELSPTNLNNSTEMDDEVEIMQTTLSTPVVQSHRNDKKAFSLLDRIGTPQSILKSRSSYHASSVASRRSVDSDDRSIRFNLPNDDNDNDDDDDTATTPIVTDTFSFGIHSRPSIHSVERTPSKLLLNEEIITTTSKSSPTNYKTIQSTSPARKRLRSTSSEALSNVTACIDVSVEQSIEPEARQLFVSSEEEHETKEDEEFEANPTDGKESEEKEFEEKVTEDKETESEASEDIVVESIDQETKKITENTFNLPNAVTNFIDESIAIPVNAERTKDSIAQFVAMKTSSLDQEQGQPIERIIPIEIEPRQFESTLEGQSLLSDSKVNRRSSIGLSTFNTSIPWKRNILTDSSECYESSYAASLSDVSVFQQPNLLSSTDFSESASANVTSTADSTMEIDKPDDIETVQIEDSDDDSSIECDFPANNATKSPAQQTSSSVEKVYKSSTPFASKLSAQHVASSDSFSTHSFHKKNILTDSTVRDSIYCNYSAWDQSSTYKPRNILTDSTLKDGSVTSDQSTMNAAVNKDSTNPVFNDECSNDIYDLSSEIDAGMRDDEYDVDDYESDSEDDIIDISSGSEDAGELAVVSKKPKASPIGKLPPCNTLGRGDVSLAVDALKQTNPTDVSKCSDTSFMTASDNSIKHLTTIATESLHPPITDQSQDIQPTEIEIVNPQSVVNVDQQVDKCLPSTDDIGVVDIDQYNVLQLDQNQVTITYELQDNLFVDNEMNEDITRYTVEYVTSAENVVSSDLNDALLPMQNRVEEPLAMQVEPEVTTTDTIAEVNDVTEASDLNNAMIDVQNTITSTEETLIMQTESGVISTDTLAVNDSTDVGENLNNAVISPEYSNVTASQYDAVEQDEKVSPKEAESISTCDLNAAVISDTITDTPVTIQPDDDTLMTPQQTTDLLVETRDQHETESDNLNEAVFVESMELTTNDDVKISSQQQEAEIMDEGNAGVILDIDEILESAVVPEVQKLNEVNIQSNEEASTSVDFLKKSNSEGEAVQNVRKRRLRSNSDAVVETPPAIMTRRRSSSFLAAETTPNTPTTSSASRTTRAKSETKTPLQSSVSTRATRAKSELKSTDEPISSTTEPVESIPQKVKRPAITPGESSTTRVTRSRTRSIAEDDDNVSIVSESSIKSSKSNRGTRTRAQSHVTVDDDIDDNSSSTSAAVSKKPRTKPRILPVISEDLSQEGATETQSYEDMRRLTRNQKKFMEKVAVNAKLVSEKVATMVPPPSTTVTRKRTRKHSASETLEPEDDDISDTGSVASSKTNASAKSKKSTDHSTPVRQSKRLLEKEGSVDKKSVASKDSDSESVVSVTRSTRSRRKSTSSKK